MKYRTRFTARAGADLRSIELPVARRILAKLTELESDPLGLGTTALVGEPLVRRLRIGDWRVFYHLREEGFVVLVIRVEHRSTAYER